MNIKFSHHYYKTFKQNRAVLLAVVLKERKELSEDFIDYDTRYYVSEGQPSLDDFYPLPAGKYMVLVFIGEILIPFTTVRRWTPEKEKYYRSGIGKTFGIEIQEPANNAV
jgi:hypothetical protein